MENLYRLLQLAGLNESLGDLSPEVMSDKEDDRYDSDRNVREQKIIEAIKYVLNHIGFDLDDVEVGYLEEDDRTAFVRISNDFDMMLLSRFAESGLANNYEIGAYKSKLVIKFAVLPEIDNAQHA